MDNLTAGNPRAHRVRVYYEDDSTTIAEGMPVCYNYLTTDNWWGGSVNDAGEVTANTTTAEGSHNKGKYIYVCNPVAVAVITGITTLANNVITAAAGTPTDFNSLQVGMFVSIGGADDSDETDGNYKITNVARSTDTGVTDSAITLEMTAAQQALVTVETDVNVKVDNLHCFAGVVTKGGWCGTTGPKALDIYVPNGAIVPVKTALAATVVGRTILCLVSNTQTLGNPETDIDDYGRDTLGKLVSKPVAVAAETISSVGLCLAKLDPNVFLHQGGSDDQELQVAAGTVKTAVNKSLIDFKNTSAHCTSWLWRTLLSGGGGAATGVYRFDALINSTSCSEAVHAMNIRLEVATIDSATAPVFMTPLFVSLRTQDHNPVMTGKQWAGIHLESTLRKSTGVELDFPSTNSTWFRFNTDVSPPIYMWYVQNEAMLPASTLAVAAGKTVGFDGDTLIIKIPIYVGGETLYLLAGKTIADSADD